MASRNLRQKEESFNEAGAINAGKRLNSASIWPIWAGFNEAGAINAGKHEDGNPIIRFVEKLQ